MMNRIVLILPESIAEPLGLLAMTHYRTPQQEILWLLDQALLGQGVPSTLSRAVEAGEQSQGGVHAETPSIALPREVLRACEILAVHLSTTTFKAVVVRESGAIEWWLTDLARRDGRGERRL